MTTAFDRPGPTVRQLSAKDDEGNHILSVVASRTYRILADGGCVPHEEQVPLVEEPEDDPDDSSILARDSDLHARKPRTDVVVEGHVYGKGRTWVQAGVTVEGYAYPVLTMGDRRCTVDAGGRPVFSDPEAFDRIPLSWTRAYGGVDAAAEERWGNPFAAPFEAQPEAAPVDLDAVSLFRYPRNPAGRGYLVESSRTGLEQLELPNLEDPWDRITPDRYAAVQPGYWPLMPPSRSTGWVHYEWFPRCAWFGIVPPFAPIEGDVVEAHRGYIDPGLLDMPRPTAARVHRAMCGAAPGLQVGHLEGAEQILLEHIHPSRERFAVRLPGERPGIWTDGRNGEFRETRPVLQLVLLEPDEDRVTLVWRGSAPALRPYLPDELETMPLYVGWP
mgnify:CR=1 FL=1